MTQEERTELINQLAYIYAYGRAVALQDVMESIDENNELDMRKIQKELSIMSHVLTQLNIKKQDKTMWDRYETDVLELLEEEAEPLKKIFENSNWKMIRIK